MSTEAATVLQRSESVGFWHHFQREAELRVREGNAIAGECLWTTIGSSPSNRQIAIGALKCPSNRMLCSFDVEREILTVEPGPAITAEVRVFQWLPAVSALRCGDQELTLADVITLILNHLVWADEEGEGALGVG